MAWEVTGARWPRMVLGWREKHCGLQHGTANGQRRDSRAEAGLKFRRWDEGGEA